MSTSVSNASSLVISYLGLRKAVGILGILLPFVLAIGLFLVFGKGLQASLSAYYYTEMRNIFVGTLCAIGVFLLSYRGYERKDDIAGDLACVFAIGTALFPTTPEVNPLPSEKVIGVIHYIFAGLFFIMLVYFSLGLFTKTDPTKTPTPQKLMRNRVYVACGYTILAAIILIAVYIFLRSGIESYVEQIRPVFWLESIAVVAFGISWLVKGEAILQDET